MWMLNVEMWKGSCGLVVVGMDGDDGSVAMAMVTAVGRDGGSGVQPLVEIVMRAAVGSELEMLAGEWR